MDRAVVRCATSALMVGFIVAASGLALVQAGRVVHDARPPRQVAAEPH